MKLLNKAATHDQAMDHLDTVIAALAEPTRRRALALLWNGEELCVCELMERLGATQSRMSRHMGVLKATGLVLDRRDAQWVRYRCNPNVAPSISNIVDSVIAAMAIAETSAAPRGPRKKHQQGAAV